MNSVNVFGLDVSGKYFIHHYREFARVWPNSHTTLLPSRSSMFPNQALSTLDFWNTDADFMLTCDQLSYNHMMNYGRNHFTYISDFLKIYQIDYSLFGDISDLSKVVGKSEFHIQDIFKNCILADIILISPALVDFFNELISNYYSKKIVEQIKSKYAVVPPPGFYKIPLQDKPCLRPFDNLNFLWNHRVAKVKRPELFFGIISKFHEKYPDIPIKITTLSHDSLESILEVVPENIKKFIDHHGFISDKEKYAKVLESCNITINTAEVESFGISPFDAIKSGILVLNVADSMAFQSLTGSDTTASATSMPDIISNCYKSETYRDSLHAINVIATANITSLDEYKNIIQDKMTPLYDAKIKADKESKSAKLKDVMIELDKTTLTKKEIYNIFGWGTGTECARTILGILLL